MGEPRLTHELICDLLGVERSARAPEWLPYAKRKTKIEIAVNGERTQVFGGSHVCACCGYGVDMRPEEGPAQEKCPRCGYNGVDYWTV